MVLPVPVPVPVPVRTQIDINLIIHGMGVSDHSSFLYLNSITGYESIQFGSLSTHPPTHIIICLCIFFANRLSDIFLSLLKNKLNSYIITCWKCPNLEVHLDEFSQSLYPCSFHYIKKQDITSLWGFPHPPNLTISTYPSKKQPLSYFPNTEIDFVWFWTLYKWNNVTGYPLCLAFFSQHYCLCNSAICWR